MTDWIHPSYGEGELISTATIDGETVETWKFPNPPRMQKDDLGRNFGAIPTAQRIITGDKQC
jgi:hypothetical protein